jgi:phage terminase large subunit-like protein
VAIKAGPKRRDLAALPAVPPGGGPAEWVAAVCGPHYSWQAPIVAELLADDRPRVAYVQVPRKNGKSRLAASVALAEMCLRGGAVYLIADSERNLRSALFRELVHMVTRSALVDSVHVYQARLECPESGGFVECRPNNLSASQSINPTLVIFDEVHMQRGDEIWNGMVLAGAADPNALLLGITTPGYDMTSLAHGLYEQVQSGELWGRVYEPSDPNCAHDDPAALREANPVLADRPDLEAVFRSELSRLPEHEYRRFRLGQWTATAASWLPAGAWSACRDESPFDWSRRTWRGFDGSYSHDSTALVAANDAGQVTVVGVWERPAFLPPAEPWRVPRDEVQRALHDVMERTDATLLYDPPYWESEGLEWQRLWGKRVVEFPTGSAARMAPACTAFYAAVLEGRVRDCSTGPARAVLAAHLANAVTKQTQHGTVITKQREWSPKKIDAAVAAVVAASQALTAKPEKAIMVL